MSVARTEPAAFRINLLAKKLLNHNVKHEPTQLCQIQPEPPSLILLKGLC